MSGAVRPRTPALAIFGAAVHQSFRLKWVEARGARPAMDAEFTNPSRPTGAGASPEFQ